MKRLFILLVCFIAGISFTHAQTNNDPNGPKFKFNEDVYDFGQAQEGPALVHKFEFTNVGKKPLIVQNATASCGCTSAEWPKQPILPGQKGVITVKYDTKGHAEPFLKEVWVQSNAVTAEPRYTLQIKGNVKPAGTK